MLVYRTILTTGLIMFCWSFTTASLYGNEGKKNNVQEVTDGSFDKDVLKSSGLVLVDFWSSWCTCCRPLANSVEKLADDYGKKLKVTRVNVEDNPAIPHRYGVIGLPAVLVFNRGKVVKKWIGNISPDTLKKEVDALLKKKIKETK